MNVKGNSRVHVRLFCGIGIHKEAGVPDMHMRYCTEANNEIPSPQATGPKRMGVGGSYIAYHHIMCKPQPNQFTWYWLIGACLTSHIA